MDPMKLKAYDFQGVPDTQKVKAFLSGRETWPSLPDYWTAGKSTVGTFQTLFDSPTAHHRFWIDDGGKFHAYRWLCPVPGETFEGDRNSWRMLIHPELRTRALASTILADAERELSSLNESNGIDAPVNTVAYGQDSWLASLLEEHGYRKQQVMEVYLQRRLDSPVDVPDLASGYTMRPLNAETDLIQRSGAQSDAFAGEPLPGDWAIENTGRFLTWYEGREDLDQVAVSPTGEIASFAVSLIDPGTGVGELDPVGTRSSHQRKGLSKALLLSGLQYMKSKGMALAAVRTGAGNTPAIRLYESVGFRVEDQLYRYTKQPATVENTI